jgi:RNA ligase (TIGR02306 family)
VEPLASYPKVIPDGAHVVVSEKIHGAQGRFLWDGTKFYCGSKNEWKKEGPTNIWWKALYSTPALKDWLQAHPGVVVFGEVYGSGVQDLEYGLKNGDVRVAVFDVWNKHFMAWKNVNAEMDTHMLPWVPMLVADVWTKETIPDIMKLADGPSWIKGAKHLREGIVIRTAEEMTNPELGRIIVKVVSNAYLERE